MLAIINRIGTGGGIGSDHRVPRLRDPRALDGRAHDGLQHVDRGGSPRGAGRPRRHDLRLPRRSSARADGRGMGACARRLAIARHRRRRRVRPGGRPRRRDAAAVGHLGHEPRAVGHHRRRRARAPTRSPIPTPATAPGERSPTWASLPGTPIRDIAVDTVFIGSCTNSRIEDLRAAAAVAARTARCATGIRDAGRARARCAVKAEAEAEGLDEVFLAAGFEWREAGCSMCLAMNPDKLAVGERCASHVEPQLRRSPGQGRAHAPRVARSRRGHRDRRPLRHPRRPGLSGRGVSRMQAVREIVARAVPLDRSERRHRPDHPERLAQAGRAHRLRRGAVLGVARELGLRAQPGAVRRRASPGGRAQLRHAARRASTRRGRSRTTGSGPSSRRASPTSSATTA